MDFVMYCMGLLVAFILGYIVGCKMYTIDKAEIAFKAYEKGKNDMLSVIHDIKNEIKEKALFSESIGEPKIASGYYLSIDTINKHIGKAESEDKVNAVEIEDKCKADFPQAKDIEPTVENFSKVLDNKLIRDATAESEDKE